MKTGDDDVQGDGVKDLKDSILSCTWLHMRKKTFLFASRRLCNGQCVLTSAGESQQREVWHVVLQLSVCNKKI